MSDRSDRRPHYNARQTGGTRRAFLLGTTAAIVAGQPQAAPTIGPSIEWMAQRMDRGHGAFFVYDDADSAFNHFAARARIAGGDGPDQSRYDEFVPPMDERYAESPASGKTCIKAVFKTQVVDHYGGWLFMTGTLQPGASQVRQNFGTIPDAGIDLRGATKVTFHARGRVGGEVVRFVVAGAGRREGFPFPDSAPETQVIRTLTAEWQVYEISLQNLDLRYCLLGFGWVVVSGENGYRPLEFYLDSISADIPRLSEPRFVVSYETNAPTTEDQQLAAFDLTAVNTAFSYDNALALMAFLVNGDLLRGRVLADAFHYALENDRYWVDGRLRNGFMGGDVWNPPGWLVRDQSGQVRAGAARLPGWTDPGQSIWREDAYNASANVGVMAWVCLAQLSAFEFFGESRYLADARKMADWIIRECRADDGLGGFRAEDYGFEPAPVRHKYKATEHSIDLFAVLSRLAKITGSTGYSSAAEHARAFVRLMWDRSGGTHFLTGTYENDVPNPSVVPVDIQVWALMSLRDEAPRFASVLQHIDIEHAARYGYGFCQRSLVMSDGRFNPDAVWHEGTAQVASCYRLVGDTAKYEKLMSALAAARLSSGALAAASEDKLWTGFNLFTGKGEDPWLYIGRPHVGATAWFCLAGAREMVNPFWLGHEGRLA